MKSEGFAGSCHAWRVVVFTGLLVFLAAIPRVSTSQGIDPNLRVGITRSYQGVILNWFGSNVRW